MSRSQELAIVLTTVETPEEADSIARSLVEQSLVACVQIDGPVTSHYRWEGQVECTREYRLMLKTTLDVWPAVQTHLAGVHPYDEPEIILIPVSNASDGYRDWVVKQTC